MSVSSVNSSSAISPYQAAFNTLQVQDAQELMQVSFATPQAAEANVLDVLGQWAALQAHQQGVPPSPTVPSDAANVPSLDQIITQTDAAANAALSNYLSAPSGSSIIDFQA